MTCHVFMHLSGVVLSLYCSLIKQVTLYSHDYSDFSSLFISTTPYILDILSILNRK
jgi:hypothetical protein